MDSCPPPYQIPIRLEHPIAHIERCRNCNRKRRICGPGRRSEVPQDVRTRQRFYLDKTEHIHTHPGEKIVGLSSEFNFLDNLQEQICLMPYHAIENGEVKEEYRSLCEECEEKRIRQFHQKVDQMFRF